MNLFSELNLESFFFNPWRSNGLSQWNLEVAIMGVLVCWSCGIVGAFIVIRRMALMGDAISHGILPGLVIAFLVSGSLGVGPMFVGACLSGLACSFCIDWLCRHSPIRGDAAMAIVFTTFFALGISLINLLTGHLDIDAACILYGEIGLTPLSPELTIGEFAMGNQKLWIMGFVCLAVIIVVALFYNHLLLASFDPILAKASGSRNNFIHWGLMLLLALVTVASLEAVGVILVVAMLVFPCATASFFFDRLPAILYATFPLGICYSFGGLHLAFWLDCSIAAAMTITATCIFVVAGGFGPKGGIISYFRT